MWGKVFYVLAMGLYISIFKNIWPIPVSLMINGMAVTVLYRSFPIFVYVAVIHALLS